MNENTHNLYDAVLKRRSVYSLKNEIPVSEERLIEIIQYAVKHTPSAFNMQSARVALLLGVNHKKLWDMVKNILKHIVPEQNFAATEQKINSFAAGYATILFFNDTNVIEKMQAKFAAYKENFPIWAEQSAGMLQYLIWTAFASQGIGANLQHYNPLIDEEVCKQFDIARSWRLVAQMPFGTPAANAGAKDFLPIEELVKIKR
ncbi:MAG: nitroreductase family protein [Elusimicrobiota bacterium]|jgi:predicted oxidoreductase (fatty acid repression mutant protein)|nr:nitroreductase family protein [Elusimicrobiota bacterium]